VVDRHFTGSPDWGISMSKSGESYVSVVTLVGESEDATDVSQWQARIAEIACDCSALFGCLCLRLSSRLMEPLCTLQPLSDGSRKNELIGNVDTRRRLLCHFVNCARSFIFRRVPVWTVRLMADIWMTHKWLWLSRFTFA
jgi:hypothetical protein